VDEARALLGETETAVRQMASPAGADALEYARAMLAPDEQAEACFERALTSVGSCSPFARARLQLAYGAWLRPREHGLTEDLTPQELQIARLAAAGLSNRDIGQHLFLSHRTVGAHLYRAFPKLGVSSRAQLHEILQPASS
jgi:DNA-binding NarL/FixJ family response regulator